MEIVAHSTPSEGGSSHNHGTHSGVAWGAVLGGSVVAAAFYLTLLALGAGFGLAVVLPWSSVGISLTKLETGVIVWLVFAEVMASALGGYLTGRLRVKWALIHTDEVHFRDTANGFLSWAVALVMSVSFLLSTTSSMWLADRSQVRSSSESSSESVLKPNAYFIDKLFRSDRFEADRNDVIARAEAERIVAKDIHEAQFPIADQDYLSRLTAAKTGITQAEATSRVSDVIAEVRQGEETVQKAVGRLLVWTFVALMMGAFSASFAATIGGRHRDHVPVS